MKMITKRTFTVLDGANNGKEVPLPIGEHEIERVPNPFGHDAPWLVVKGTLIGQVEEAWRQYEGEENGDWEVTIKE